MRGFTSFFKILRLLLNYLRQRLKFVGMKPYIYVLEPFVLLAEVTILFFYREPAGRTCLPLCMTSKRMLEMVHMGEASFYCIFIIINLDS